MTNIGMLLLDRADRDPDAVAFRFIAPGGTTESISNLELASRVFAVEQRLGSVASIGDRVLLLNPPGLDYVVSFFGCLAGGFVAVPAFPPINRRHGGRVRAISEDCDPSVVLCPDLNASWVEDRDELAPRAQWLAVNEGANEPEGGLPGNGAGVDGSELGFLQYTSGSTGQPKGVMVTHQNLIANAEASRSTFELASDSIVVSWLPPYHDMGLIGGIVTPVVLGFESTLMAPATFIRKPVIWLRTISELGATISPAPNFGYDLCVDRITEDEIEDLDLSSWTHALNGAEPVRANTLERFASAFAGCGFNASSFRPCYGMAETTLLVSGRHPGDRKPNFFAASRSDLDSGRLRPAADDAPSSTLVSCGGIEPDATVMIVDRENGDVLPDGQVGEVLVSSPSVALGYYGAPEATQAVFGVEPTESSGRFLATGDLGAMHNGELFVTGRLKDLLIVNGRNVYPQDIEELASTAHPVLHGGRAAAFSVAGESGEDVVAAVEVRDRRTPEHGYDAVERAVRQIVAAEAEVSLDAVVLVRRNSLPVTSSGKIRRSAAKDQYLKGTLHTLVDRSKDTDTVVDGVEGQEDTRKTEVAQTVGRLISLLAELTDRPVNSFDPSAPLSEVGVDSVKVIEMTGSLSEELGYEIPPSLAWEAGSLTEVADAVLALGAQVTTPDPNGSTDSLANGDDGDERAVVVAGLSCRLPGGVENPDDFWQLLIDGRSALGEVPVDRWDAGRFHAPMPVQPGRAYTTRGGFLNDVAGFDSPLFGLTKAEADEIDPQQRMLMELAWAALEDAGIAPDSIRQSDTGVFIGIAGSDYERIGTGGTTVSSAYTSTGCASNFAANRLSYALGLEGPSLVVDTACSSSLVAVHLAMQSLRRGECGVALVGGVNLMLDPRVSVALCQSRMLSPSGWCRPFDARADGYIRGEGGAMLVLHRSDVEHSSLPPRGRLLGSAMNQDGRSNGLTAPNGRAQSAVVSAALADANIHSSAIGYVEAHGTGTPLGDPVEARALSRSLATKPERPVVVGAVKANVGHLEAAAGVVGLIKALLVTDTGVLPPQPGVVETTAGFDWENGGLRLSCNATTWNDETRLAGVSSFGFGGTNAHVIVGNNVGRTPSVPTEQTDASSPVLVKMSAATEASLFGVAGRLAGWVDGRSSTDLETLAASANATRADLAERSFVIASNRLELSKGLEDAVTGSRTRGRVVAGAPPKVAFVAPGHGAPIAGVLDGIYGREQTITESVNRFGSVDEWPLRILVDGSPESKERLRRTDMAQPALYALAYALGSWWQEIGVQPVAVLGHSVGSYAAAALAGVFDPLAGFELITERGRLCQELVVDGAMLAMRLGHEDPICQQLLADRRLQVAVVNSKKDTVIAGPAAAIEEAMAALRAEGKQGVRLGVSRAFHSPDMESVLDELGTAVQRAQPSAPTLPFVSDRTGALATDVDNAQYWRDHTRQTLDFSGAVSTIRSMADIIIELGPAMLTGLIERCDGPATHALASLHRGGTPGSGTKGLLEAVGGIWLEGAPIKWNRLLPTDRPLTRLPTYPFESRHHWVDDERWQRGLELAGLGADGSDTSVLASTLDHNPSRERAADLRDQTTDTESAGRQHQSFASVHVGSGGPDLADLVTELRSLLAPRLGVGTEQLPLDVGLFDLGLTSVMATELKEELERRFTVELGSTALFDYPTLRRFAEYLVDAIGAQAHRETLEPPSGLNAPENEDRAESVGRPTSSVKQRSGNWFTESSSDWASLIGATEPPSRRSDLALSAPVAPSTSETSRSQADIAIVGMGCRFPGGANDPASYWSKLVAGYDGTSELPDGRWVDLDDAESMETPLVTRAGFLQADPWMFEPSAFGMSPREARSTDPQQRLLLEVVWEALDDAGIAPTSLAGGAAGVYVGMNTSDYLNNHQYYETAGADPYLVTGNTASVASGRIAHLLGTTGPAITLDTACSSALTACHEAVLALRRGDVDLAIVGGINLMLSARTTRSLMEIGALSPSGRSQSFGAAADGYGRGEGCGVVVLKRAGDARRDRDRSWAVIRGSAVNHDGSTAGLTVPSGPSQKALITAALNDASVDPNEVSFVEAHGTGTPLGDPIELEALSTALRPASSIAGQREPLPDLTVGSAKANIGHLEAAAGIAGLIKLALGLNRKQLPIHVGSQCRTELVDWEKLGLRVADRTEEWVSPGRRHGAVSSFGFSGTNAHMVLAEAVDLDPDPPSDSPDGAVPQTATLVMSSSSAEGLVATANRYAEFLENTDASLAEIAWTALERRDHHRHRLAISAESTRETVGVLRQWCQDGQTGPRLATGQGFDPLDRQIVTVFSGHGTQWNGMVSAAALDAQAVSRLEHFDRLLQALGGGPLSTTGWWDSGRLSDRFAALTAIQITMIEAWKRAGLTIDRSIGYSAGELAALVAADVLDAEDALALAFRRGQLIDASPPSGATAAVGLGASAVTDLIADRPAADICIAAISGVNSTTVAGTDDLVKMVEQAARDAGTWATRLSDTVAFHSPRLMPAIDRAGGFDGPSLSGTLDSDRIWLPSQRNEASSSLDLPWWLQDLVLPVPFTDVVAQAVDRPSVFLQVGPAPDLGSSIRDQVPEDRLLCLVDAVMPGLDAASHMARTAGKLFTVGVRVDPLLSAPPSRPVDLPMRSWRRTSHSFGHLREQSSRRRSTKSAALNEATFRVEWSERSIDEGLQTDVNPPPDRWLVVGTDGEVVESMVDGLADAGHDACSLITDLSPGVLVDAVAGELTERLIDVEPIGLVVVGQRTGRRVDDARHDEIDAACAVLEVVQLFQRLDRPVRLWLVTPNGSTAGNTSIVDEAGSQLNLSAVGLWGLGRAMAVETPHMWGGMIDPGHSVDRPDRLVAELLCADGEDQVAYRHGQRWCPRLVAREVAVPLDTEILSPHGSYVVTGGRGSLGLRMARWLAGRGARHIVLTGRTPIDEDLAGAPSEVTEVVTDLRAEGVTVHLPPIDITKDDDVARLFSSESKWPAVRGVLHLAGVFEPSEIGELSVGEMRATWRPKVEGAQLLDRWAQRTGVDFLLLFSSASSVWGTAHAPQYVAANYGLDVLAERAQADGRPVVSVNWSWWANSNMAGHADDYFLRMGLPPITEEMAWAALDSVVTDTANHQLVVALVDWRRFKPVMEARRRRPLLCEVGLAGNDGESGELANTLADLPVNRRLSHLMQTVRSVVSLALGRSTDDLVAVDQGLFDAGMDSMMSMEVKVELESMTGLELDAAFILEYPRIVDIADQVLTMLGLGGDDGDVHINEDELAVLPVTPTTAFLSTDTADGLDDLGEAELAFLLNVELANGGPQ